MVAYHPSMVLSPRYYHPAMVDTAHLSIKLIILIVIIIITTLLIGCFWCSCCCSRRRRRAKKQAQNWFKGPEPKKEPKKERRFRLPSWMSRRGKSHAGRLQKVVELELPRYSSIGKVDLDEVVVPKKVHKKGWKNADLY
jgi:hypothetical protein